MTTPGNESSVRVTEKAFRSNNGGNTVVVAFQFGYSVVWRNAKRNAASVFEPRLLARITRSLDQGLPKKRLGRSSDRFCQEGGTDNGANCL